MLQRYQSIARSPIIQLPRYLSAAPGEQSARGWPAPGQARSLSWGEGGKWVPLVGTSREPQGREFSQAALGDGIERTDRMNEPAPKHVNPSSMNLTLTRPAATLSHPMGEGLGVRAILSARVHGPNTRA